ncbi:hypothetical protein DV736_g3257, partial [Chaetothyriales sp. CBS 134916]
MLELANIPYVIFERDISGYETTSRAGTLDIHAASGQLTLQEGGQLDQFKKLARRDAHTVLADAQGKVYIRTGDNDTSIPADKVRRGLKVQHVQRDADGSMSVHLTDGSVEAGFRLVVGADGAWSKARDLITSFKPQYSGLHYLTTTVSPENPFHSAVFALAGQGDGSYYVGAGLHLPENWGSENAAVLKDPSAIRWWLLNDHFANWPQLHTNLIKHSDGEFYAWPLYALPSGSLSWSTVPGVTLIGDAAHLSTPFVGEGVNCAMTDSLQLAQQIIKHGLGDLDRAVSEYEKVMLPRGIDLINRSTKSGDLLFAPDTPRGWLKAFAGIDCD